MILNLRPERLSYPLCRQRFANKLITRPLSALLLTTTVLLSTPGLVNAESLDDAWQLALAGNFKIKAAEQQQLAADAQLASANAGRLPDLTLAADYLKLDDSPTFETTLDNATPFSVSYFDEETMFYSATTTLPLYTGGRITADINAAEAQQSAATANTSHSISTVKISVAKAYINVLRAQSAVVLATSHVRSLSSHQNDVQNLLNQGLVARNNLLTANVALADARQQLLQVNNQVDLAKAEYNRLLNRPLNTEFTLEDLAATELTQSLADLSAQALINRADIQALQHRSEVLEQNAIVAGSISKPQLGLSGTYFHHNNRLNTQEDILAANVSMIWKVFDGGSSRQRSNQLQRQAAATRAQQDELSGVVQLQVRQAWLTFETARQGVKIASGTIEQAEENLRSSKNRFQAGLITNSEVLDAENLRVQAHNNHNHALFNATFASLQLKHVAGIL